MNREYMDCILNVDNSSRTVPAHICLFDIGTPLDKYSKTVIPRGVTWQFESSFAESCLQETTRLENGELFAENPDAMTGGL